MIKAIIIDDEPHCIDRLAKLLTTHCGENVVVQDTANTVDSGCELIERLKPDLVFLDIRIQDETGFDLLRRLPEITFEVVFCTAYEQYALRAFKFSALDYLLKPIDVDDLTALVARLQQKHVRAVHTSEEVYEMAMHNVYGNMTSEKRIAIPTLAGFTLVKVNEIVRCKSDVNYTTIHFVDKTDLMVARTLKDFEEMLEPYGFIRLHNSHLINIRYIKRYHKGKGGYVVLEDHTEIEVSMRRKNSLMEKLGMS